MNLTYSTVISSRLTLSDRLHESILSQWALNQNRDQIGIYLDYPVGFLLSFLLYLSFLSCNITCMMYNKHHDLTEKQSFRSLDSAPFLSKQSPPPVPSPSTYPPWSLSSWLHSGPATDPGRASNVHKLGHFHFKCCLGPFTLFFASFLGGEPGNYPPYIPCPPPSHTHRGEMFPFYSFKFYFAESKAPGCCCLWHKLLTQKNTPSSQPTHPPLSSFTELSVKWVQVLSVHTCMKIVSPPGKLAIHIHVDIPTLEAFALI